MKRVCGNKREVASSGDENKKIKKIRFVSRERSKEATTDKKIARVRRAIDIPHRCRAVAKQARARGGWYPWYDIAFAWGIWQQQQQASVTRRFGGGKETPLFP